MFTIDNRPFRFDDICGQKIIVNEMKRRSKTMDFPPVMIFEGESGTGKSTLAFLLASLISDPNPIVHEDGTKDPNPESPACKAVLSTRFNRDISYKDASSMTKDDVIRLQSELSNAPMFDKAKVVIIDECFRGDTLVWTERGDKRIDEIKAGDLVYTRQGLKPVKKVFRNTVPIDHLMRVHTKYCTIRTTIGHRFMTDSDQNFTWKEARCLNVGDSLLNRYVGEYDAVMATSLVRPYDPDFQDYGKILLTADCTQCVHMYDLEVEDAHEYYAGGVLVHNCQELSKAGKGATLAMLEKRRKDTYIILCTMDANALDKAVKSRGALYDFKSPKVDEIAELLFRYTDEDHLNLPIDEEHQEFYEKGIMMIAENCGGSVRQAVQNFERCIAGELWKASDIEHEFGILSQDRLMTLLAKLVKKDKDAIKDIREFGTKDFYYKLMKTLGDSYVYQKTGYIDQQWKRQLAENLSRMDIYSAMNTLLGCEKDKYFREDLFLVYLTKVFYDEVNGRVSENVPPSGLTSATVRKPVRRSVVE